MYNEYSKIKFKTKIIINSLLYSNIDADMLKILNPKVTPELIQELIKGTRVDDIMLIASTPSSKGRTVW